MWLMAEMVAYCLTLAALKLLTAAAEALPSIWHIKLLLIFDQRRSNHMSP